MPTLTVAGHSVTVGDEFLKLSPEEQNSTVDEIAKSLPAEKPSGPIAGLSHGISGVAGGIASTLGLAGVQSDRLDRVAENAAPKDYKAAPLIRPGGHFYNPSDWQPGNIPQFAAEMAPGIAMDITAGKTGAAIGNKVGGVRGGVIGGLGAGLGSMALRTFGPGAHENAEARTGDANAPVSGSDMLREGGKQLLTAPINAAGLNRFLPGVTGAALKKYAATIGTEAAAGGARDAVGQAVTNVGQEHGKEYDPNRTAEAVVGGGVLGGTLAAPKLAGDAASNFHFRNSERTPEARAGAEALAARHAELADGRSLVGTLGGTKVAAEVVNNAHDAVHRELAAATKGEALSTDNANTLARINDGGKVSDGALKALSDEASPETMHLAHQAIASAQLKSMGNLTDKKFTGGISGGMESLSPIANPVKAIGAAGLAAGVGHAAGLGLLGTYGFPAIGGIIGTYGVGRALDKLTGLRSPAKGFQDRYGGTDTPTRLSPEPTGLRTEPLSTSVPQVAPPKDTALWGSPTAPEPSLRAELNTNAKLEEGMARIAKQLGDAKRKSLINDPMSALKALAATRQPEAADVPAQAPEAPFAPSPIAKSMLLAKLKAGLPPEPAQAPVAAVEAPAAPPEPVISPIAKKMLLAQLKKGLPPEAAPVPPIAPPAPVPAPVPEPAPAAPTFNPTALAMLKQKLKVGLPPVAAPAAPVSPVPGAGPPASPAISALMQKLQGQGASSVVAGNSTGVPAPDPVIAKINKAQGKPVEVTPHPEEDQPYTPIPEEGLWRKRLTDEQVADQELSKYSPKVQEKYRGNIIENRGNKRDLAEAVANDHTPADANAAAAMYHQLDTISRRKEAARAIKHYTAHMTAEAANAVRAHFTPAVMKQMWHTE